MVIQKVLLMWVNPLFYETVRLLLAHPAVTVEGVPANGADVRSKLDSLRPDIIIFEAIGNHLTLDTEVLQILGTSDWEPRIIRLSLQDNELWLYRRELQIVEQAEDLLQMILRDR